MTADDTSDTNDITAGSLMTALARNWWVIAILVVVGAVIGALLAAASPKEYTATSSVYIGQTTDANGNPMAGLNSNVKAATQLLGSQAVLNEAAKAAGNGVKPGMLRRETTIETPSSTVKTTMSAVNIVVISVTDTKKVRATAAANALANALLTRLGGGVSQKITLLEAQLLQGKKQYADATARAVTAQRALMTIARGGGSTAEKNAAGASYVAVASAAATDQAALASENQKTEMLLLVAKQVEQPRLLHEAAIPDSPSGPDMKLDIAAGALAGLVIGCFVALGRWRLTERRNGAAAASAS